MSLDRECTSTCGERPRRSERTVAEVVSNRRRRYALYYLREQSRPVELDELIAQVAAWECCTTPEQVSSAAQASVGESFEETHLPYLAARGIVRYDRSRNLVTYCADDPDLATFLANDPRTAVQWHRVYLLLTAVAAVFVGLAWLGVPPLGRLNPVVVAGLVVAAFALASGSHWYDVHRWRRRNENRPPDFLLTFEEDGARTDEAEGGAIEETESGDSDETESEDSDETESGDADEKPR